jgi:hypothetical protein
LCRLARRCGKTKSKSKPQTRQASHWQASLEDSASKPTRSASQKGKEQAAVAAYQSETILACWRSRPACRFRRLACPRLACRVRGLLFVISDLPTLSACLPAACLPIRSARRLMRSACLPTKSAGLCEVTGLTQSMRGFLGVRDPARYGRLDPACRLGGLHLTLALQADRRRCLRSHGTHSARPQ